ncbi:MAG: DUF72 domain-containing protein [candidate division NC10 bacterium]|nr:DUF72 domain-containing protein [candidate division NC10 bacterium]MDE2321273.1 DUF72 domain-containing protein [candidate division NC10 bacterium]
MIQAKIGTCGFAMGQQEYYKTFPIVEIQQTFYKLPRVSTGTRWRAGAPTGFTFTMKAWQLITHEPSSPTYRRLAKPIPPELKDRYGAFRPTDEVIDAWTRTRAFAAALGATVIVFQCPPSFTPTPEHIANLRHFFTTIDRAGWQAAWEPRDAWAPDTIRGLCRELDLIHVVDPLKETALYGVIRYYRLHGLTGYRYVHTDQDLERLKAACEGTLPTYCLFNNLFMAEDAVRLQALLEERTDVLRPRFVKAVR